MARQPGTYAVIDTSEGTIVCKLFEKEAPKTVAERDAKGPAPKPKRARRRSPLAAVPDGQEMAERLERIHEDKLTYWQTRAALPWN